MNVSNGIDLRVLETVSEGLGLWFTVEMTLLR